MGVVDTSPGLLVPAAPPELFVELPSQPRYGPGIGLDLLRLDPDRLVWRPAGQLTVDPGGRTASGPIASLGTYLLLAPPFGQFGPSGDDPAVNRFAIGARADGQPVDVFGLDTPIVYASFDYGRMDNTTILVRTVDAAGNVVFEARRPYAGDGRDNVPMVAPDNRRWPVGSYLTTVYVGQPPVSAGDIGWRVASAPTPTHAPATLPPAPPVLADIPAPPVQALPGVYGCAPPVGWWPRPVVAGDTLSALAWRTGSSVVALMQANCLASPELYIGQLLYLPRPPAALKPRAYMPTAKPPSYPHYPSQPGWPTWPAPAPQPTDGAGPPAYPTGAAVYPSPLPGFPEATPWKTAQPPGGWTPPPAEVWPTPVVPLMRPTAAPPPAPPVYPTNPPPVVDPPPVTKWTPPPGPQPTLAPRPTVGP
jgi:hypothetical protein